MNTTVPFLITIAALILVGGIWYAQSNSITQGDVVTQEQQETATPKPTDKKRAEKKTECPDFSKDTVKVDDQTFKIGIAKTPAARERGLGGCPSLANHEGLYFSFADKKETAFWMKGMVMPIDIIWIADEEVVGIEHSVQPPDNPDTNDLPIYESPQSVDAVLEIAAGEAKKQDIIVGSKISF